MIHTLIDQEKTTMTNTRGTRFTAAVDALPKNHDLEKQFQIFEDLVAELHLPAEAQGANIYQNIHVFPFPESTPYDRFIAITREDPNVILGTPHRDTILHDDVVRVEYIRHSTTVPIRGFTTSAPYDPVTKQFTVPVENLAAFIGDLIDHLKKTGY